MHKLFLNGLIILFMIMLQSCQAQPIVSMATPTGAASITSQPIASSTQSPTQTAKQPSPTSIHTLTPTTTPTRTRIPTSTVTWTPLPTLSAAEAQALVLELLETNGGCKLPCWWGMTPGKTEWIPSKAILDSFAIDTYQGNLANSWRGYDFAVPAYLVPDGEYRLNLYVKDGFITSIDTASGISLSEMFSDYGMPKDILLNASSSASMLPYATYQLVLYYPDQGIFAIYEGETQHGSRLQICQMEFIKSYPPPYLHLWSPDEDVTIDEIRGILHMPTGNYAVYYPIEDISGINREEFYKTYVDPANAEVCFEIPDPDTLPTPTATSTSP